MRRLELRRQPCFIQSGSASCKFVEQFFYGYFRNWIRSHFGENFTKWKPKETILEIKMWDGVNYKLENAKLFYGKMQRSLPVLKRDGVSVALESSPGTVVGTQWQREFYAYFDAFLAMARSVPEIINFCFGKDFSCDRKKNPMHGWFDSLCLDEKKRRSDFSAEFNIAGYDDFKKLPLSGARNVTLHRQGYPSVIVEISGLYGVVSGTPVNPIPETESSPGNGPAKQHAPFQPTPEDFTIDGKPLFEECTAYLQDVENLVLKAREICHRVHGNALVTLPPT